MPETIRELDDAVAAFDQEQFHVVGREHEQELLRQQITRLFSARGTLILIHGEAGVGKTTLVDWLADAARRLGALVLAGGCYDLGITPPYGPWLDALEGYRAPGELPDLRLALQDRASVSGATSQELFEQVRAWLAELALHQPLVLLLEDLHWTDTASLELLRFVARRLDDRALLVVVTWRDDVEMPQLSRLLPAIIRESQPLRIALQPLSHSAMRALITHRYLLADGERDALSDWLHRRAEGNPFLAGEILFALERAGALHADGESWRFTPPHDFSVPPLVRQVIEQRLSQLSETTQRVLEQVAILGQDASLSTLQATSELSDDQLAAAINEARAGFILTEDSTGDGPPRFRHALLGETLYQRQQIFRRRARHRRVAELLLTNAVPPPISLAHHFQAANDPRAVIWLAAAGDHSLAVHAPHDAITSVLRAEDLAARFGTMLPRHARRTRGLARQMIGDFDRAREDFEHTLRSAQEQGDQHSEWQALLDLGALWAERDYDRAGPIFQQALALARASLTEREIAHSLNAVGNWHVNHEEPQPALRYHQEAKDIFTEHEERHSVAATLDLLALAQYVAGDVRGAAQQYRIVVELLKELNNRQLLSSALANWATSGGYFETDAVAAAEGTLQAWMAINTRARDLAREIGWAAGQAYAEIQAGAMLAPRGDMGQAMIRIGAGMALAKQIGHKQWMVCGHVALGRLHADLLDVESARPHLEAALSLSKAIASPYWATLSAAALGSMLIDVGELETAGAIIDGALAPSHTMESTTQRRCQLTRAQLMLATDQPDRALRIVDQLIETAPNSAGLRSLPWPAFIRGQGLGALGQFTEAEASFGAARLGALDLGYRHLLWRTDLAIVKLLRDSGRGNESGPVLVEALAVIEEIAATLPSENQCVAFQAAVRSKFHLTADRPGEAPNPAGLSTRETQVLRLVAIGLTDAEVAQQLSISRRTVGRHLESIYAKLGVGSRTAAAAFAYQHGLMEPSQDS